MVRDPTATPPVVNGWLCAGTVGSTERFWGFSNPAEAAAWQFLNTSAISGGQPARVGGGHLSSSAMKLYEIYNYLDVEGTLATGTYIVSGWFNTRDSASYGQAIKLELSRGGSDTLISPDMTLNNNPDDWQRFQFSGTFSGNSTTPVRIHIANIPAINPSHPTLLVDDLELRRVGTPACGSSSCLAQCPEGMAGCENIVDNASTDTRLHDAETPRAGGVSNTDGIANKCDNDKDGDGDLVGVDCDDGNAALHHDAFEGCDDNLDSNCNGRGVAPADSPPYSVTNLDNECLTMSGTGITITDGGPFTGGDAFEVFLDDTSLGAAHDGAGARSVAILRIAPGFHKLKIQTTATSQLFGTRYANFRLDLAGVPGSDLRNSSNSTLTSGSTTGSSDLTLTGPTGSWMELTLQAGGQCTIDSNSDGVPDVCSGFYTCIEGWCYQ